MRGAWLGLISTMMEFSTGEGTVVPTASDFSLHNLKRQRYQAKLAQKGRPDLDGAQHKSKTKQHRDRSIFEVKCGRKPKYRPKFENINDLGSGLERPHPKPRKNIYYPKRSSPSELVQIISIRYTRRRCTINVKLKSGNLVNTEHFLYWDFSNGAKKLLEFFGERKDGSRLNNPYANTVYRRMFEAAEEIVRRGSNLS